MMSRDMLAILLFEVYRQMLFGIAFVGMPCSPRKSALARIGPPPRLPYVGADRIYAS